MRPGLAKIIEKVRISWYLESAETDFMDPDDSIEDPESPEQQDVCAAQNFPWLIQPTRRSKKHAERVLVKVNAI